MARGLDYGHKLSGGQTIYNVHSPFACVGEFCTIHAPSDHHMRNWPQYWDDKKRRMLRSCPHQYQHPDPDQPGAPWDHICCGCCVPEPNEEPFDEKLFDEYRNKLRQTYEDLKQ